MIHVNTQLRDAYLNWLERNFFQFAPSDFKKQLKEPDHNEAVPNNVVYVNFIKKKLRQTWD